jgi:hypothetical protein
MNILYVFADNSKVWNSSEWRCAMPMRAINRQGKHKARMLFIRDWLEGTPRAREVTEWADIIIVQRDIADGIIGLILKCQSEGKKVVAELDDDYTRLPENTDAVLYWKYHKIVVNADKMTSMQVDENGEMKPLNEKSLMDVPYDPLENLRWGVKICDAIQTPSAQIAEDWKGYNEKIFVVPNFVESKRYLKRIPQPEYPYVIGWGGSYSHIDSFRNTGVLSALERVSEERGSTIAIIGEERISSMLHAKHKKFLPRTGYKGWFDNLVQLHIGIAPLDGTYDRRRSWIKAMEYSLMGIPWVGTDYGKPPQPYTGWEDHLVYNTAGCWERALLEIIDHYPMYQEKAKEEQAATIEKCDIDKNVNIILETYASI